MPPIARRLASADRCAHRQTRRRILIVIALLVLRPRLGATCGFPAHSPLPLPLPIAIATALAITVVASVSASPPQPHRPHHSRRSSRCPRIALRMSS
ncbi:hypothetical protein V8E53_012764 [Lactarius tabidus]